MAPSLPFLPFLLSLPSFPPLRFLLCSKNHIAFLSSALAPYQSSHLICHLGACSTPPPPPPTRMEAPWGQALAFFPSDFWDPRTEPAWSSCLLPVELISLEKFFGCYWREGPLRESVVLGRRSRESEICLASFLFTALPAPPLQRFLFLIPVPFLAALESSYS